LLKLISTATTADFRRNLYRLIAVPIASVPLTLIGNSIVEVIVRNDKLADKLTYYPSYAVPALLGFLSGFVVHRWRYSIADLLVWSIPLILFVYSGISYARSPWVESAWGNLVGPNCSASECLSLAFITGPLVFGIAFSLGSLLNRRPGKDAEKHG